jgi:hypothetical protein
MKTLPLALLFASLPIHANDPAPARPIELVCDGYLTVAGKRLGRATVAVSIDLLGKTANITGQPVFQPVNMQISAELHQYSARVPGWSLYISRSDMTFVYESEGRVLDGRCMHNYALI